jgi:RNA polymerase sigma factor (sigma-70 family)
MALHLCQQMLHDWSRAEDAVQEAVLQAWLSLEKLRHPERFGAWLVGIVLHVSQSWLRYRAARAWSLEALLGGRLVPEPVDLAESPLECAELRDLQRRVRQAIKALPAGQRTAVTLFYLADLSHAEIAALLGIPSGAVKSRLHKGRDRLRRTLLDLWLEEHMTNQISDFIDVQVADVRAVPVDNPPGERRVVLLAERDGQRTLPVWVGGFEGDSIAIGLLHAQARRPLTFAFASQLLEAAGARLQEVRIARLVDETFYAQVVVQGPAGERAFDARPSDAIALALEAGAPIRVSDEVMQKAGVEQRDLAQKTINSRSARDHVDEIRERLAQPIANWSRSTLF